MSLRNADNFNASRRPRRGFTLTEILVILGIILLILAIALPAFTAITSSRSQEASKNLAASALSRARAEAIRRGVPCGVYFYVDLETQQTAMALVTLDPLTDPDPYDEYKAFLDGVDYQGPTANPLSMATGEPYMTSDRVRSIVQDDNELYRDYSTASDPSTDYSGFRNRPAVLTWLKTPDGNSAGDGAAVDENNTNGGVIGYYPVPAGRTDLPNSFANVGWAVRSTLARLEPLPGTEVELLPIGVGLQVLPGTSLLDGVSDGNVGVAAATPTVNGQTIFIERYFRSGLIAFDERGQLMTNRSYEVATDGRLGTIMGLPQIYTATPGLADTFVGGSLSYGLVIYDEDEFKNAPADGTALTWEGSFLASTINAEPIAQGSSTGVARTFTTTLVDATAVYPTFDRPNPATLPDLSNATNDYDNEFAEERWLDANTTPMLVNRFSGVLSEASSE